MQHPAGTARMTVLGIILFEQVFGAYRRLAFGERVRGGGGGESQVGADETAATD